MSKDYDFKLPAGFSVPEGKGPGDTIEVMATLQLKDGGMACIKKLGDAAMNDDDGDEKPEPEQGPQNSDFISAYQNQMSGAGGSGAQSQP